ncbi:glycosyltransferase, partial [Candidatus Pelagibacter sp.]|nr:glycosyltransferase [Candidatus Pelagibacter sp.]
DYIISTIHNFIPDIVLFGHVDSLNQKDLFELKDKFKNIKFSQYFVDTLDENFENYAHHKSRFFLKYQICDTNFITTDPSVIDFADITKTFYIPNVCDYSIDVLENYKYENLEYDIFFALSHGQHRGNLKKGYIDERVEFLKKINNHNINKNFFGIDQNPIWGERFFLEMGKSKMGLNYNRGSSIKYYSSDRICSLIANGLLTFLQKGYAYEDFFEDGSDVVYFDDHEDLQEKILFYSNDYKNRAKIAESGKKKYFDLFDNQLVTRYMIQKIFDSAIKEKKQWMD